MPRAEAGDAEIIREAKARFERCVAWESVARENARQDARFANGDARNRGQWDSAVLTARGDRPCLTMNKTRQHILQIVNDARQHKAQIKVTPTGNHATYEAAQIFSGIIRRIEYQSKATDAYSTAIYHQVETGIGYVRVRTDYADEESFDQEIFITRVSDPNTIYLDPDARQFDKSDMRFAFVFDDVPRDVWEARNGKDLVPPPAAFDRTDGWNDRDHVREAEYWRRNENSDTLHQLSDGTVVADSELPKGGGLKGMMRAHIVSSRQVARPEVEWFRIAGDKIIERKTWPGRYIPIVPFIGEEVVADGALDRKGHTRALIDAQKIYNYWSSAAVEQVALQGKSPYIAPARAVAGYERAWNAANQENRPYLPYNDMADDGTPIAPPVRSPPPQMAQAYIQGMSIAKDDMMAVSGQYQAMVGANGNEISGTAIQQRQRQGDNAVYHYIDNQAKGIRQVGRICLDMIPKVYDRAQVLKVMGEDGQDDEVALLPNAPTAHQHVVLGPNGPMPATPEEADEFKNDPDRPDPKVVFNPNVGRYDIEADVGPSYATQRQEAANAFSQIMAQNPAAFQIVGDFWALNSDFPGADELAERLKQGLPPQYKGGAPDPQVQQMQQHIQQVTQQGQQIAQKADAEVSRLKAELVMAQEKLAAKGASDDNDVYRAETERLKAVAAADPAAAAVLIRSMLSQLLGMPALPVMHEHQAADAAHQQDIAPPPEQAAQPAAGAGP